MGYTGLMENSTKVLNIVFAVPRHILVIANRFRRPNTESKFSFLKEPCKCILCQSRNSNNFSNRTPNHNGSPSVPLKHTVRMSKKSLGMKQIDKAQMGLQK